MGSSLKDHDSRLKLFKKQQPFFAIMFYSQHTMASLLVLIASFYCIYISWTDAVSTSLNPQAILYVQSVPLSLYMDRERLDYSLV